ncbi:hypothetical protein IU500_34025 [Nocardia terpenica]|uniref:hypothetical protein n=1 Tax=Nocardia terpenica TaxID=455432 RepID=UPI0002DD6536|nr:hypothetical protein [Nocardia terpenica]MBF6066038.1 hypothetical protein [Nocardia terpenica]MBF6109035.1 hypothetical protein [Nocardia terpenica]MBF6116282.1 hypothetical protein [Nocardia terpenica]MBF6123283.1 hypothetical protein [Nocardia terpenica]MBF6156534.1 hypothetical protein [Nocardia terpenica]
MSSRNRLLAVLLIALAGGAAWLVVNRRSPLPEPAAAPPRLGYSSNGSAPQAAARLS